MSLKNTLKLAVLVVAMAITFAVAAHEPVLVADGGPIWICRPGPHCVQPPNLNH